MEDFFGILILSLLLTFGFIQGPIYNTFNETDTYVNNYVKSSINDFQKQVRDNGYVDYDTYNKFLHKLNKTKTVYKIQLIHSSKLVYPSGTNDFKLVYVDYGNKAIWNTIYAKQKYYMRYGDDFNVKVTEIQMENSKKLTRGLFTLTSSSNSLLTFQNGGMVQNEAN